MKKSEWIVSPAPFLLTHPTISKMSLITGLTLLPILILLAMERDVFALIGISLALLGSICAEMCYSIRAKKNTFGDGSLFIAGILIGLLLPSTLPVIVFFMVSFSGVLIARVLFGGAGSYWMNPVAAAVCIAYISHPSAFPDFLITANSVETIGDAFGALRLDHFTQLPVDQSITQNMNSFFLKIFGIKLPEGYITLFWNSPSVIPAFRYNLIILLSSIILISMSIIDWIVPLVFLLSYGLCIWFFSLLPFGAGFSNGDILFAFLTSGILFVAFYVLPEYSTTPRTQTGKAVSGLISGALAFFMCGLGGSSVGAVFTVILINTINPLIEYLERKYVQHIQGATFEHLT